MQGLAVTARSRSWYLQRLGPAAQRGVIRDRQSEPEQMDDGTDQPLGLPQRQTEHGPERQRRQDRQGRIPQLSAAGRARGSAFQAATASSVNQTVKLPR